VTEKPVGIPKAVDGIDVWLGELTPPGQPLVSDIVRRVGGVSEEAAVESRVVLLEEPDAVFILIVADLCVGTGFLQCRREGDEVRI
jgi:hypothetical protein